RLCDARARAHPPHVPPAARTARARRGRALQRRPLRGLPPGSARAHRLPRDLRRGFSPLGRRHLSRRLRGSPPRDQSAGGRAPALAVRIRHHGGRDLDGADTAADLGERALLAGRRADGGGIPGVDSGHRQGGLRDQHARPGPGLRRPAHHAPAPRHGHLGHRAREGLLALRLLPLHRPLGGQRRARPSGGPRRGPGPARLRGPRARRRRGRHRPGGPEARMTLEELVGRRLVFGLVGPDLTDTDVRLFRDTRAGGIMLYRRNFETPERLRALLEGLEGAVGRRLLVTTDHEGGRIIMLNRGATIFPDGLAAGTAGETAYVERQGRIEGREMRRLGVEVNFGPVLDVLTDRYSPNIGIRSYGKDPNVVTRYGLARIKGMQKGGISACAKHFPGKGHSPLDAHLKLPTIDSTWADMKSLHLPPFFGAIAAGIEAVMTSHPVYPHLDPS